MKTLLCLLSISFFGASSLFTTAQAQVGGDVGGGLQVYVGDIEAVGVNVRGSVVFANHHAIKPDLGILFNDPIQIIDFNLNYKYRFMIGDKVDIGPLAGLNVATVSADGPFGDRVSDSDVALNLGGGFNFYPIDQVAIYPEVRFRIDDAFAVGLNFGAKYVFGR